MRRMRLLATCAVLGLWLGVGAGLVAIPGLAQESYRLPGPWGPTDSSGLPQITFELWFAQLEPTPEVVQNLRSQMGTVGPAGTHWVIAPGGPPELAQLLQELLASSRDRPSTARAQGSRLASGHVVGTLGYQVRVSLQARPVGEVTAGDPTLALPDLGATSFLLELVPRSVDRLGRVETTVRLQVSGNADSMGYSHSLWLDATGTPLAIILEATDQGTAYALNLSAQPGKMPQPHQATLVSYAALDRFERQLFTLLDKSPTRLVTQPTGAIGLDALVAPAWPLRLPGLSAGFRLPFTWGGFAEAAGQWFPNEGLGRGRLALHHRLVYELDLVVQGTARFGWGGPFQGVVGVGLGEVTHPTPNLSLQARYLPLAYRTQDLAANRWERVSALWELGAGWRWGRVGLEAGVLGQGQAISEGRASLSVKVWGELSAGLGYRYTPDTGSPHNIRFGFTFGAL